MCETRRQILADISWAWTHSLFVGILLLIFFYATATKSILKLVQAIFDCSRFNMNSFHDLPPHFWARLGSFLPSQATFHLLQCSHQCAEKTKKYAIRCANVTEATQIAAHDVQALQQKWPQLTTLQLTDAQATAIHKSGLHRRTWPPCQVLHVADGERYGGYHELPQFVAASLPVAGPITRLRLGGRFRDQGWGNTKGRFYVEIMRCHSTLQVGSQSACPVLPVSPAESAPHSAGSAAAAAAAAAGEGSEDATSTTSSATVMGFVCVTDDAYSKAYPFAQVSSADDSNAQRMLSGVYKTGTHVSLWRSVHSSRQMSPVAGHEISLFQRELTARPQCVRDAEAAALQAAEKRGEELSRGEGHASCWDIPSGVRRDLVSVDEMLAVAQRGDVVQLHCIAGGGGGHELHWDSLKLHIESEVQ